MWLNWLKDKNAQLPKGWVLLKREKVEDSSVDFRLHSRRQFDSMADLESYDNHTEYSEWGDVLSPAGYWFALRYQYCDLDSTAISKTGVSRDFCVNMVALSESGVQYRYEDIADMSADGINGQFAAKGESTYDIFEWKGGKNCYHWWERLVYIYAPDGDALEVDDAAAMEYLYDWDEVMMRVGNNPYVPQPGIEGIPTIEMQ